MCKNLLYLAVIILSLTNELLEPPGVAGKKKPVTMVMVTNLQKGYQDNVRWLLLCCHDYQTG